MLKSPCPFCGSVNLGVGFGYPVEGSPYRFVYCNDCGCEGPKDGLIIKTKPKNENEAIKLWNIRDSIFISVDNC